MRKLTYANVMSSVAAFLALGGGAVYAAERIGSNGIAAKAVTPPKLDRNAVTANKIAPKAVRRGKLAPGAVARSRIAASAVGSDQVEDGSILPADLEFPTQIVASPMGGALTLPPGGPTPYPLTNNTWTQQAGQLNVAFGSFVGTLAYDDNGAGSCSVNVNYVQNGVPVGGGFMQTSSTTPVEVSGSAGAAPGADPDSPTEQEVNLEVYTNGCTVDSQIDRSRFRILAFG